MRREPQRSSERTGGNSGKRLGNHAIQRVFVFEMWDCIRRPDVSLAARARRRKARAQVRSSSDGTEALLTERRGDERTGERVRRAAHLEWTTGWVVMASWVKLGSSSVRRKAFRIVSSVVPKQLGTRAILTVGVNAGSRAVVHESGRLLGSCQLVARA